MNEKTRYKMLERREAMKGITADYATMEATDQQQKLPYIPPVKEPKGTAKIELSMDFEDAIGKSHIFNLLAERESCRDYSEAAVSLKELSYLLWATQGIRRFAGRARQVTFRNVPSAGSRHPFETYLFVRNVDGLVPGIYHYLPEGHELEIWDEKADYAEQLTEALNGQTFAGTAPVTFVWSVLPYRTEWRYGFQAHKYMMLDAGHMCENLYLACESIGCGTCAIGSYNQELLDELMGFEPGPSSEIDYEFTIYAAPVGKKKV